MDYVTVCVCLCVVCSDVVRCRVFPVEHNCQQCAEGAVRNMLKALAHARQAENLLTLHAVDYMDDGSIISLTVSIDASSGDAVFDFEGEHPFLRANIHLLSLSLGFNPCSPFL